MITPEHFKTPPPSDAQQDDPPPDARMTLEELARTLPYRNIWGAFKTYRGELENAAGLAALGLDKFNLQGKTADPGANPMGAAPTRPAEPSWRPAPLPNDADEATRAAYAVAIQQMQAGEDVAKELAQTALVARAQDVPTLLNRLLETYSDLGSVFIQLIGAALAKDQAAQSQPAATPASAAPGGPASMAVEVTASCPVTARALLYAPLGEAPQVLPLVRTGGDGTVPAPTITAGPVIQVTVPADAASGEYHGIILATEGGHPAGTVTLRINSPS